MNLGARAGRGLTGIVGLCLLAGLTAACGSALDPTEVAQGGTGTSQGGGSTTEAGGGLGGTTGGTGGGVTGDTGTSGGGTTGDTTGGGTTGGTGGGATEDTGAGGGTTGDTTGGGTTGGTGGTSTGGTGGAAPDNSGGSAPGPGAPSASGTTAPTGSATGDAPPTTSADACAGFQNGPGITSDTITIGNSSDVSGPVPGLFAASQDAVKAYVQYFNATSSICGRKLKLITYDSKTDAGADQQAYVSACSQVFAMVGSTSAFDSGGAATAQACGLPDLRSATLTQDRARCTTCFGAQSTNSDEFENAVADYVKKYYPDGAAHAAMVYLDAGASSESAKNQMTLEARRGLHYDYVAGISTTEFNYAPYAQAIKDKGVKYVQFIGSYQASVQLQTALQQIGYRPDIYMQDPTVYVSGYASSGGDAVDGTTIFTNFVPFAEAGSNQAMQTYLSYLQQSNPSAEPTFFGVFSWSAAVLFTQLATQLGGKLTRASLVQAMSKVDNWTAGGMTEPQHVGAKNNGDCWRFLELHGTTWVDGKSGAKPMCDGVLHI